MSHWLDETGNWLEIFKRKLGVSHKDLYVYLDKVVEESSLEFLDLQACALASSRVIGYPVYTMAIEKNMGTASEKVAAAEAAAMESLNNCWVNFQEATGKNQAFFENAPDVILPYGGVTVVKYHMYCLSAAVALGSKTQIKRYTDLLKDSITEQQLLDIIRISSIIVAAIKTQT